VRLAGARVADDDAEMLEVSFTRARQKRLLSVMAESKLDAVVVGARHHVYYLSAFFQGWQHEAALVLLADGGAWLTGANAPASRVAVDEAASFEASWNGTTRQEQPAVIARQTLEFLRSRHVKTVGVDASAVTSQLLLQAGRETSFTAVDDALHQLRRPKDPDELALMKRAIACTEAMYGRAKQIIEPGVSELHVFTELNATGVKEAGEPLTALLGNDYACGVGGGPARGGKTALPGQLYVLDLGPAYRGYFADNCRVFSVDRKPTDEQMKAWHAIVGCFPIIERLAKPGARCRDIVTAVDEYLTGSYGRTVPHHLGHGVGLQPHEFPHLNHKWDDVLIEGEIFTAEPGLYGPDINGGLRIENDYLVTRDGVVNLLNVPMELV